MDIDFLYIGAALCIAGIVKGVIGFGLPIVAVSILSLFVPIEFILALLVFPIFVTNFLLAIKGGHLKQVLSRFWPLILSLGIGLFISAQILVGMKQESVYLVLGCILIALLLIDLCKVTIKIPPGKERILSIPIGLISGVMGGISTSYGPPIALFLSALKLPKELYVSVLGTILCSGSIILGISFSSVNILNSNNVLWSVFAVIPCTLGLWLGAYLRHYIPQEKFYRLISYSLIVVSLNLIRKGLEI